jgi:hypothetical protein
MARVYLSFSSTHLSIEANADHDRLWSRFRFAKWYGCILEFVGFEGYTLSCMIML